MTVLSLQIKGPTQTDTYSYRMRDADIAIFLGVMRQKMGLVLDSEGNLREPTHKEIRAWYVEQVIADLAAEMTRYKRSLALQRAEVAVTAIELVPVT